MPFLRLFRRMEEKKRERDGRNRVQMGMVEGAGSGVCICADG
ncbi:hypothetical protein AtDm6_3284 [Acetobacter tropicalis]|uniref:Uncharacterized protein n=1 Tax=Acetobacter tropicalis TaxID=104102 RepID=A0A094YJW8_9PROT|nr:hypothetical protein AtDm6_3284 [Acetobacter tropicalis]